MGCGADGVCGAGHDAFHGIYTFFHGGADYAECFHRQPVEPDSGSVRLENCKAGTILRLARAFHVSVEELLMHGGEHPADYPEHRAQSVPEDEQTALCALLHALSQLLPDS